MFSILRNSQLRCTTTLTLVGDGGRSMLNPRTVDSLKKSPTMLFTMLNKWGCFGVVFVTEPQI